AIAELDALIAREPSSPVWLESEAHLLAARLHQQLGEEDKAVPHFEYIFSLGGKDYERIRKSAEHERKMRTGKEEGARTRRLGRGRYLMELGRCREALAYCRDLEIFHPDDSQLIYLSAQVMFRMGDLESAFERFRTSLEGKDREVNPRARLRLCWIKDLQGERESAINRYNALLKMKFLPQEIKEKAEQGLKEPFSLDAAEWYPCRSSADPSTETP
ncbi:tetratricopeptide repeat protein, partial [Acidobacteriota bacterium]